MLRAVRFAATLDFALDPTTAEAIREMAGQLIIVSAERIAQELKKMLVDRHRRRAIELSESTELLPIILPELNRESREPAAHEITLRMLELLERPSFELALAVLLHSLSAPVVVQICKRLKLSNDELERINWLVAHQDDLMNASELSLARLKRTLAHPFRDDLITMMRVKLLAMEAELKPALFCEEYLLRTPGDVIDPAPLITGDTLKSLGMNPGPTFRTLLETVRDAQLNGEITTVEQAIEMARAIAGAKPE